MRLWLLGSTSLLTATSRLHETSTLLDLHHCSSGPTDAVATRDDYCRAVESDPSARFERFGHPDFDWSADVSLRPALVAAVYHQHRLVLAARTRVGATFTAALVARRLASLRGDGEPTEAAVRKASRWLSGQQPLSAADELEWREIFDLGDEPETRLRRLHDLDAYPPSFAQSLLVFGDSIAFIERHSVHWQSLGAAIRDAVEADNARLPIGFVTSSVLRGHVVRALIAAGVDRDLLRPQAGGLVVLDTVPVTVIKDPKTLDMSAFRT